MTCNLSILSEADSQIQVVTSVGMSVTVDGVLPLQFAQTRRSRLGGESGSVISKISVVQSLYKACNNQATRSTSAALHVVIS